MGDRIILYTHAHTHAHTHTPTPTHTHTKYCDINFLFHKSKTPLMLDTTIKAIYSCARTILVYGDYQGKGEKGVHHQRTFSLHLDGVIDPIKAAEVHNVDDSDEESDVEKDVLQIDIIVEDLDNNKSYFNNNNKPICGIHKGNEVQKEPVEEKQQGNEATRG